jgi:hypothetical protein
MANTDGQLLEIASGPVDSIPDVVAAFEAIDALLPQSDGLRWFNWLYLQVTKAVDQSVGAGNWERPEWIARLDVRFARLYLDALAGTTATGQNAPQCWQVFFSARNDVRLARVQFALAGMNAHIDHDLSVAVVETCKEFGGAPVHGSAEYRDYTKVNDLLDTLIDQTKHEFMVGLLGDALPALGKVEDMVAGSGLCAVREIAWTNGEVLWGLDAIPALAARFVTGLDRTAALAGQALLLPVVP